MGALRGGRGGGGGERRLGQPVAGQSAPALQRKPDAGCGEVKGLHLSRQRSHSDGERTADPTAVRRAIGAEPCSRRRSQWSLTKTATVQWIWRLCRPWL